MEVPAKPAPAPAPKKFAPLPATVSTGYPAQMGIAMQGVQPPAPIPRSMVKDGAPAEKPRGAAIRAPQQLRQHHDALLCRQSTDARCHAGGDAGGKSGEVGHEKAYACTHGTTGGGTSGCEERNGIGGGLNSLGDGVHSGFATALGFLAW